MISIVDDDEFVRESTKALVRSFGYNARVFASAEDFLDANLDDTSCLILDVQMKGFERRRAPEAPDRAGSAHADHFCHSVSG